jgi:tetratricopeptide (TPR) repeat protein
VGRNSRREEDEDPVRRRELLAGIARVAGAATLGRANAHPTAHCTGHPAGADPAAGLEQVLFGDSAAEPLPLATLRAATVRAREAFQAARYHNLGLELPPLIAAATTTCEHADGDDRRQAAALLADAYTVACNLMVKLNDDTLAWATADRAFQAALRSDDPLALADARRALATVLRRTGRAATAHTLLTRAARDIRPDPKATPVQLSMYGTLLAVAAYTAAVDGNRDHAHELITEAAATAGRLGADGNHRYTAFGPTNVTLYQISIAQVLGDCGTAIQHAATIRPAAIATAERQGRYWVDVARAHHQWGKHEQCYRALRSAERAAPDEVRYRPPVHRMTMDLLRADRRHALPGLRAFADRVGIATSA